MDTLSGSLALDPTSVQARLSERTRAVVTLPLWGYPNDDHETVALLADAGIPVIDDACQAHGTTIAGRYAGTWTTAGCFSTHDRKLLSTGEGGFVLTNDEQLADRIDFYTHLGHLGGRVHGVNYKLAAPLAAIGLRRLTHLHTQLQARQQHAGRIIDALPADGVLRELAHRPGDAPNYCNLVLTATDDPQQVAQALSALGLPPDSIRYRYRPVYHHPIFAEYAATCPNAEALATTTVQLPVHPGLPASTVEWVGAQVAAIARGGLTP